MPSVSVVPQAIDCRKVLLVEDHPVLRVGLVALIDPEPDLTVCGEASTVSEALQLIESQQPDLAIIDLSLAGSDGLDLLKILKSRHSKVLSLVLSMHDEYEYAPRCLRAGARGYLHKQNINGSVPAILRRILNGEICISKSLTARLAQGFMDGGDPKQHGLSDRELKVYRMIGEGNASKTIAEALNVCVRTIESHIEHIKNKNGVRNAAELARQATAWVNANR